MNAAMTLILACVGIFGFFILLFGFLLLFRYINYREKIKLAEKGIYPSESPTTRPKKGLLVTGWIITTVGFLATIVFWLFGISVPGSGMGNNFPLGLGPWVLLGLFPLLLGLILILIYVIKTPVHDNYRIEKVQKLEVENSTLAENNFINDDQNESEMK